MSNDLIATFSFDSRALLSLLNRKLNTYNLKKYPLQSTFVNDVETGTLDPEFAFVFGETFMRNLRQLVSSLCVENEILFDLKFLELEVHSEEGQKKLSQVRSEYYAMRATAAKIFTLLEAAVSEVKDRSSWVFEKDLEALNTMALKMYVPFGRYYVFSSGKVVNFEKDLVLIREMIAPPKVKFPIRKGNLSYTQVDTMEEVNKLLSFMNEAMEVDTEGDEPFVSKSRFQREAEKIESSGALKKIKRVTVRFSDEILSGCN